MCSICIAMIPAVALALFVGWIAHKRLDNLWRYQDLVDRRIQAERSFTMEACKATLEESARVSRGLHDELAKRL